MPRQPPFLTSAVFFVRRGVAAGCPTAIWPHNRRNRCGVWGGRDCYDTARGASASPRWSRILLERMKNADKNIYVWNWGLHRRHGGVCRKQLRKHNCHSVLLWHWRLHFSIHWRSTGTSANRLDIGKQCTPKHIPTGWICSGLIITDQNCLNMKIPVWRLYKKNMYYIYIYLGRCPLPVTVTTRIITFLIGNPYKPSFATVTGRGPHPIYIRINDRQVVYFPGRVEVVLYFFSTTSMAGRLDPQIPDTQKYRHHHVFGWLFFWQLSHDFKHESYSKRPI